MNDIKKKDGSPDFKGGYLGKVLKVDLTNGTVKQDGLPPKEILKKYIGCWGLGLQYLYDMVPPGIQAVDAENPLIFMTAPLTGLQLPGATNITLATKNYNTGYTVGRAHTHSHFGPRIKKAGYDGVIITGRSDKPVYLSINNDKVELREAGHIWGKYDTDDTEDVIKAELGYKEKEMSVAAIGPVGENLVVGAMICNDKNHAFSHSGVGAVMGSKNLKAIAVFGNQPIPVADTAAMKEALKDWYTQMKRPGHFGYSVLRGSKLKKGDYRHRAATTGFCGKNFLENQLHDFGLGIHKQEHIPRGCPSCPVGCTYDTQITTGPHKGYYAKSGPGGEPFEASGAILRIMEPGTYIRLADLYDRLGIECSMAGCTMAMAFEAYERGIITKEMTGGLELKWGDGEAAEKLLRMIAYREGIGDILAMGMKRAAEILGGDAPSFACNIKGSAMNLHDWRSAWGIFFSQIVGSGAGWCATGADYFCREPDAGFPELTEKRNPFIKPLEAKMTGIIKFMNDSCGLCMLDTWGTYDILRLTAQSINAATGWELTREDMFEVGYRVMQQERCFNVRHGLVPEDDWNVTPRLIDAPVDGPAKGEGIRPYLKGMVEQYYRLMGWDEKTGKPWRSTLKSVGLGHIADDIWR